MGWLGYGFTQSVLRTEGPMRAVTVGLVAVTLVLVGALLLAPPVRPAEVALAGTLLDVPLPDPAELERDVFAG